MVVEFPEEPLFSVQVTLFALLAAGLFTSCDRHSAPAHYEIVFGFSEFTPPQEIADPGLRELYVQMMEESYTLTLRLGASWEVWIDDDKFDREDRQAVDRYNGNLASVKEFEAKWREMFEEFGVKDGSSFSITFTYNVKRWLPSEKFNYLQEYNFELSNN